MNYELVVRLLVNVCCPSKNTNYFDIMNKVKL